jgi:hypothetical protein
MAKNLLRVVTRALVLFPITGLLMAPTCDQSFNGSSGSSANPRVDYKAFGDSIPSGNIGSSSSSGTSLVHYYAGYMAAANNWYVVFDAKTVAGETTAQIRSTMQSNSAKFAGAEVITFNAGGNDLLAARSDFGSCGDQAALANAVQTWRANWDSLISTVAQYRPAGAAVRTMTLYYPDPDNDRATACGTSNRFKIFLPHGLAASHYMCATAVARGWRCVDAFSVMNCDQGDAQCPNIAYLNNLAATGQCPVGANGMMDHNCIRNHLAQTGNWDHFRNPTNVLKANGYVNLIQSGDIHPNQSGHDLIGAAHHALGYADCATCPSPPVQPRCGDGTCNGSDTCGNCPDDCGPCPYCGDGTCGGSESCTSCDSDCGVCPAGLYLTGLSGGSKYYTLEVPADGNVVTITTSGGTGDCDLHVKKNSAVSTSTYDCRPYKSGNAETCSFTGPGTYNILLNQYSAWSGVTLDADYTTTTPPVCGDGSCNGTETCSSCANDCGVCNPVLNETNLSVAASAWTPVYTLTATNPTFRMFGGSGDADLYVRLGSAPTTSTYNCRPYTSGNTETCTMSGSGTWYVAARGYSAASGFSISSQ